MDCLYRIWIKTYSFQRCLVIGKVLFIINDFIAFNKYNSVSDILPNTVNIYNGIDFFQ